MQGSNDADETLRDVYLIKSLHNQHANAQGDHMRWLDYQVLKKDGKREKIRGSFRKQGYSVEDYDYRRRMRKVVVEEGESAVAGGEDEHQNKSEKIYIGTRKRLNKFLGQASSLKLLQAGNQY